MPAFALEREGGHFLLGKKWETSLATFSEKMVEKIEELLKSAVGLTEVSLDGQTVKYTDLIAQYEYWKRKVAIESGTRPIISRVNMSGGV